MVEGKECLTSAPCMKGDARCKNFPEVVGGAAVVDPDSPSISEAVISKQLAVGCILCFIESSNWSVCPSLSVSSFLVACYADSWRGVQSLALLLIQA